MPEKLFLHGDESPPYLEGSGFDAADLLFLALASVQAIKSRDIILGYKIKEEFVNAVAARWDVHETGSPAPLTSDGKAAPSEKLQKVRANKIYL